MSIPPARVETPEFVWATPDETLEQVRGRLESQEIKNKWRAYVLVRSGDGRYGTASVFDIRPLVWKDGPAILRRPLRDLGLFHLQRGVEQDSIDLNEAEQLASQYGGHLVVLRDGQLAGLFRQKSKRRGVTLPPDGAFDLFDDLLPASILAETEFVEATPNTTVAKVAKDLKSKRHPELAFIVVRMADGSFRVMSTRDLNREVKRLGAKAWPMPLLRFKGMLHAAESREYKTLYGKQARTLAEDNNYLVVTTQGRPAGLLLGQVIRRTARLPDKASLDREMMTPSLFDIPLSALSNYADEAKLEEEPRFVNLWFEHASHRPLQHSQALILGSTYHLTLNVGRLLPHSIIDWDHAPGGPLSIVEPQDKEAFLYISLFSQDFDIPNPTKPLRLPQEGDTELVRFELEPLRPTRGGELATLEVCLYYRTLLVQTFRVRAEVVAVGETARTPQPQSAKLIHARTTNFPAMEKLLPRELSLTITRDATDWYRFTFLVDPDPVDEPAADRAIELSCRVRVTRTDLTHLITKARRQLYNITRSEAYQQDMAADQATSHKAIGALALLGRQLYSHLFEQDDPGSSARQIAMWIKKYLPEGSTLQVVDRARDFVFPWSLVYDKVPWDEDGLSKKVDLDGFWGYRYKLELLTEDLLQTYQTQGVEVNTSEGLRIGVGLNRKIPWSLEQRDFFEELRADSGEGAKLSFFDSSSELTEFLQKGDQHLFYVFCHGFTERMAADIELGTDLIGEFKTWLGTLPDHQRRALKDQEDSLFNVSDSWIKLTYGKIPLTMMEYYAAPRLEYAPLVFLNMCESAQVLPSLSGGFIPFFMRRGARGIIGTECPMTATFAHPFAQRFLRRFLEGQTVGEVLWKLRRKFLEDGNPLGLAYTLYCDADTKVDTALLKPSKSGKEIITNNEILERQIDKLWFEEEDDLYVTLGINQQAVETAEKQADAERLEKANQYDTVFSAEDTEMGVLDDLRDFGRKWWAKLEPEIYDLLCNNSNKQHDEFMKALADGAKILAMALAPALVAQAAALPAVAVILATIAAKKIAETGLATACEMWEKSLAES